MQETVSQAVTSGKKKNNPRILIIAAVVGVIILLLGALLFLRRGDSRGEQVVPVLPTNDRPIPTVDSSVKVSVEAGKAHEFALKITGIPSGTRELEYVITYETKDGGLPGISSSVSLKPAEREYEKKDILLGTCSTGGACVFHELASPLTVVVKFIGDYGEQLFQGDFLLE